MGVERAPSSWPTSPQERNETLGTGQESWHRSDETVPVPTSRGQQRLRFTSSRQGSKPSQ